jgi:hypothetical protein
VFSLKLASADGSSLDHVIFAVLSAQATRGLPSFLHRAPDKTVTANANALALTGSANGTTDQISAAFIGGALTSTLAFAINNRINAYMAALGVNIY